MRASRTAVEGLVDFQTLGILLFQNKQTQASRGARLHEAVRGEHPSCTGFLDRHSEFQKGGVPPTWVPPWSGQVPLTEAAARSGLRRVWGQGQAPCWLPGGQEPTEHAEPRATVHVSPGRGAHPTVRGLQSHNVTEQKTRVVFSPHALSL